MKFYSPRHILTWNAERLKLTENSVEGPTSIGYVPVFTSMAELRKHFPTAEVDTWNVNGPRKNVMMDGAAPDPK